MIAVHDLSVAFCFLKHLILLKFMFEGTQHKQYTKRGICLVDLAIKKILTSLSKLCVSSVDTCMVCSFVV